MDYSIKQGKLKGVAEKVEHKPGLISNQKYMGVCVWWKFFQKL
jgi:hypothetical protein